MKSLRQEKYEKKLKEVTSLKPVYIQGYENLGYRQIQEIISQHFKSRTRTDVLSDKSSISTIPVKPSDLTIGLPEIPTPPAGNLMCTGTPEGKPVPRHSVNNSQQDKNKYPPIDTSEPSSMVVFIIMYIISVIIAATINKNRYFNKQTGYVYISTDKFLVKIFGHAHQVDKALDYAVGSGILMKLAGEPTKYPAQYKVNPKFLPLDGNAKVVTFQIHNLEMVQQIQRYWREQKINESRDAVTLAAEDIVRSLQIDAKKAKDFIERSYQQEWNSIRHNYIRECTVGLALMKADFTIAPPKTKEQIAKEVNLNSDDVAFYPKRCRVGGILKKTTINPAFSGVRFKRPIRLKKDHRLRLLDKRKENRYFVEQLTHKPDYPLCRRDKFGGRMTTPLTKSPKSLREFLLFKYSKDDLYLIDLSNAQPLLMLIPLMKHFKEEVWKDSEYTFDTLPEFISLLKYDGRFSDVLNYIELVQNSGFYEKMFFWLKHRIWEELQSFLIDGEAYLSIHHINEDDTEKMRDSLLDSLPRLRTFLRLQDENKNIQLIQRLNKVRRNNKNLDTIISQDLIAEIFETLYVIYADEMGQHWHRKIKRDLAHYVFYGLESGQPKVDRNGKIQLDYQGKPIYKKYTDKLERIFEKRFNGVHTYVHRVKKPDYKLLTKELQHLEAEIMVDTVLNQLTLVQGRKNILSLHDGIVCPSREVEQVKLAIGNAFQKWQIQVPIKIQNLSNPDELVISDILNQPKPLTRKFFYEIRVKGGVRKFAA